MGLQRCHYKPGAVNPPARTTNGPALNNIKGQIIIMPTGAHGPERKKKNVYNEKRKEKNEMKV